LTYLPSTEGTEIEDTRCGIFLKDAIAQPGNNTFSNYMPLIIAAALGGEALRHLKLSTEQNSSTVYDFWTHHYKLDKTVLLHLAHFRLPRQAILLREYILLPITHLTLLGVSILIHMRAFERAQEAGFAESLVNESRRRFEKPAMEVTKACQQRVEFSHLKASSNSLCIAYTLFLLWFLLGYLVNLVAG
jgi:hypothetical protein